MKKTERFKFEEGKKSFGAVTSARLWEKKSQLKDIFIYKCEEGRHESKY